MAHSMSNPIRVVRDVAVGDKGPVHDAVQALIDFAANQECVHRDFISIHTLRQPTAEEFPPRGDAVLEYSVWKVD